jgi:hypothetical protein
MKNFRLLKRTRQVTEYSCGASALQSVLAYWGKDVDEHELMALMGTTEERGHLPGQDGARGARAGIRGGGTRGADAGRGAGVHRERPSDDRARPGVAEREVEQAGRGRVGRGHYITVLGVDDEYVYFQDPYVRMCKAFVSRRIFEDHWHQVMGGDHARNPKLMNLGIFVRGEEPAPTASPEEVQLASLDFAKLGSLNLIVTEFPGPVFALDVLEQLKDLLDPKDVRPNAFMFLSKTQDGQLFGMEGSGLQEGEDAAETNAVVTALTSRMVEQLDEAATAASIEEAVKAAAQGDFGLSAGSLKALGMKLAPGHSALVVLFENLWERKFRRTTAGMGGTVINQTLITAEELRDAAKGLIG